MKIRWLRMTGIGPFAGAHTVDFSVFDESGLFLLEGPTGAGKSTLIDAITFALYGDVARTKDASKDRLRSNHISDSDPSEADLVFEVAVRNWENLPCGSTIVWRNWSLSRPTIAGIS